MICSAFILHPSSLESEPSDELNRARTVALRRDDAEIRRIDVVSGRSENDVIEQVQKFGAKLQFHSVFSETDVSNHRKIEIAVTVAAHVVVSSRSVTE